MSGDDNNVTDRAAGYALRYQHLHSADAEAVNRILTEAYPSGWRVSRLSHSATITHRRFVTEWAVLDEVQIDGRAICEIRPVDAVVAIQPRAGTMAVASDPAGRLKTPVIATEDMPNVIHANTARFHVVSVDGRLLNRVAAEDRQSVPQIVRFLDYRARTEGAARRFTQALDYVVTSFGSAESAHQPMLVGAAARLLSAALLECFPCNTSAGRDLLNDPHLPPALKGAISLIHRHAADGIGVVDVAESLRITPRAVQYLFRHHLDTTPTDYLRRIRLHRAHQDLLGSDRATTTVGEIAQRWGFRHAGRFAALYRRSYGQSPHSTLQH
ncbi:helix-turn-helix transcriptional regulator [Mycobacterium vicinigordonae]|uniref:Helix-turn-helix domain-containing protein n=1 Tax=Mycobacterium vicinigordonae TaxID=1719132 RepID=A0A7D6I8C7_9MYCO|nr:helix-turn-helix transcriptional regulator [Mycobacterium vicinigordonae]QLL07177.1 helix-turn-helix domain-containing protein [Mycobacterium vicinigordonae]